jgi:hypothetical protein
VGGVREVESLRGEGGVMSERSQELLFVLMLLVLAALAASYGFVVGRGIERDRALDAGVAEWRVDKKTGKREVVYLSPVGVEK